MAQRRRPDAAFATLEKRLAAMGELDFGTMTRGSLFFIRVSFYREDEVHKAATIPAPARLESKISSWT